jgi:hypothetical protein
MAVVSSLGSSLTTAAGAKTVTATPALLDLIVVITCNSGRTTAQAGTLTDNNTDGHGTYQLITDFTTNTSADSMWIYVRSDAIQKAVSTVWTFTPTATDTGGGLQVWKITGMTLASLAAVRQSGIQSNHATGTPAIALGVAALTTNPLIGAVMNVTNPAAVTQPTGFASSLNTGWATPTEGVATSFASSGVTASTITWGGASASAFGSLVVEFSAAQGAHPVPEAEEFGSPYHDRASVRSSSALYMEKLGAKWTRRRSGIFVPSFV